MFRATQLSPSCQWPQAHREQLAFHEQAEHHACSSGPHRGLSFAEGFLFLAGLRGAREPNLLVRHHGVFGWAGSLRLDAC